jgi:hypothetical protein
MRSDKQQAGTAVKIHDIQQSTIKTTTTTEEGYQEGAIVGATLHNNSTFLLCIITVKVGTYEQYSKEGSRRRSSLRHKWTTRT